MALSLDTRQRAMLQEMGITVWMPKPAVSAPHFAPPAVAIATPAVQGAAIGIAEVTRPSPRAASAAATDQPTKSAPIALPIQAPPSAAAASTAAATTLPADASLAWRMAPVVQAYPQATGGSPDDAWLVIWECPNPATPLEGDSGKLLNNMLRALRLHHSAHVWIAGMQRAGHQALPIVGMLNTPVDWQDLPQGLAASIARARPARLLLLGMHAARAVLGSQEALGRLRAQVHQVQNIPTVVSYDPAYLLRSPHAKPAAWSDLCRAHALRPPPAV